MKYFSLFIYFIIGQISYAQTTFKGYFYNKEYNIYLIINLHEKDVEVPNHEILGLLQGYLGKRNNSFYWLITNSEINSSKKATIELINEYGSEDLVAELQFVNDSTISMKQKKGNSIKVPNNGKWLRIPKEINLIKNK